MTTSCLLLCCRGAVDPSGACVRATGEKGVQKPAPGDLGCVGSGGLLDAAQHLRILLGQAEDVGVDLPNALC